MQLGLAYREEAWCIEILPERIVTAGLGIGIKEELGVLIPKDFVGRKLDENLRVGGHVKFSDASLFPVRQSWIESHHILLEYTQPSFC